MERKLKPCPFCGSRNIEITNHADSVVFVQCEDCFATFPHFDSEDEAITAWNKRYGAIIVNNFGNGKQIENKGHITINVGKGTK